MTVKQMSREMEMFLSEANTLQWRKNADYHPDGIAMLEILHTAFETGITVEQDLWARSRKQLSALRRFVIEGLTESESPRSRMIDVSVYMAMMSFWTENKFQIILDTITWCKSHRPCHRLTPCLVDITTHGDQHQVHLAHDKDDVCEHCAFLLWIEKLRADTTK